MKPPLASLSLLALLGWAPPSLAAPPVDPRPWAATLRAGVFVLNSNGVSGHPAGPDVELTLGRSIYDLVSIEVNAGAYAAPLTGTGTQLTVVPLTVSLQLTAAPEHGFEPYAVAGLGAAITRLRGGSLAAENATTMTYHAGLGVRRMLGEAVYGGLEARYVFQSGAEPELRLDGLRISLLAGARF